MNNSSRKWFAQIYMCSWVGKEHLKLWKSTTGCRQAKMFIRGPDKRLTLALRRQRRDLRAYTCNA